VVSSTKPLSYGGILIKDFSLTLPRGRIVKVTAKTGEAVLQKLVETDEGSARLGEVALVPHSSPISQSGLLFYNTLFDENASNHMAIGRAYRFCLKDGPRMTDQEFTAAGGNDSGSRRFYDWQRRMNVDGLNADNTDHYAGREMDLVNPHFESTTTDPQGSKPLGSLLSCQDGY
jgi:aminopeptidase